MHIAPTRLTGYAKTCRSQPVSCELPVVVACPVSASQREPLEQYISSIFNAAYGAKILEYFPLLFGLQHDGDYVAGLGLRGAASGSLFCEQYLDSPVEREVERLFAARATRGEIMELGNLVSSQPGQSPFLYLLITFSMHRAGVKYLTFTANKAVRSSIRRSGFTPKIIQLAESDRLGLQGEYWGTYYDGEPFVMLADIALTAEQAMAQPHMRKVLALYEEASLDLAMTIREYMV
jgi:hypothetical protein